MEFILLISIVLAKYLENINYFLKIKVGAGDPNMTSQALGVSDCDRNKKLGPNCNFQKLGDQFASFAKFSRARKSSFLPLIKVEIELGPS